MRHQRIEDLGADAALSEIKSLDLTRRERLERWAELLEREPSRRLKALWRVEFVREQERASMRADESPMAVAFADPILRAAGLDGDTLGDAEKFFELSSAQAHDLLCDCHYVGRMDGETVARRVRAAINPSRPQSFFRDLFA